MSARFREKVAELSEDQSLFEAELTDEKHSKIIQLGQSSLQVFKDLTEVSEDHFLRIPDDVFNTMTTAIDEYMVLMMPPKMCGGWCNCIKPMRSGEDYEKELLKAHIQLAAASFIAQLVLLDEKVEGLATSSIRYAEYVNRMNHIATTLERVNTSRGITDEQKGRARNELFSHLETIERFIKNYFEDEKDEFRKEALHRITATADVLGARHSRRSLVKAQASLQEVMNSASGISGNTARDSVDALELLKESLGQCRASQTDVIAELEGPMLTLGMSDVLEKGRKAGDAMHQDLDSKLRDAIKRWKVVKQQSIYRQVVVYEEDGPAGGAGARTVAGDGIIREIQADLKSAVSVPTNAVKGGAKAFVGAATAAGNVAKSGVGGAVNLAKSGAGGAVNIARSGVHGMVDGVSKVGSALGIDSGSSTPATGGKNSGSSSTSKKSGYMSLPSALEF